VILIENEAKHKTKALTYLATINSKKDLGDEAETISIHET